MKKCQKDILRQIKDNGKHGIIRDGIRSIQIWNGKVECPEYGHVKHYCFRIDLDSLDEQAKEIDFISKFDAIPEICKNCKHF